MSRGNLVHGDFAGLVSSLAFLRPGYSPHAIRLILGAMRRPAAELDAADVGAGTGRCRKPDFAG